MKKHVAGMLAAFLFMWFGAGHSMAPFILIPSVIFANAGNNMLSYDPAGTIGSFIYFPGLLLLFISLFILPQRAFVATVTVAIALTILSLIVLSFSSLIVFFWLTYRGFLIFILFVVVFFVAVYKKRREEV